MSKITFENKKGKITLINKLSYPEAVNERVYNAIAAGMFEGFLPVSIHQKRKKTRIECVAQGLIPLTQYFNSIVTRKMFLDIAHEIALLMKCCEKSMVNANNLDLQNDKIFVDPQTKSVKCIYWPVVNNQRGNPPQLYLKQLPFELNFNPLEDNDYLETYKAFFEGINPFSVNNFDRMVLSLSGEKLGHAAPPVALGGNAEVEKKEANTKKKRNIEYDPFADDAGRADERKAERKIMCDANCVYCSSCGAKSSVNANFCAQCGFRLKKRRQVEERSTKDNNTVAFGAMLPGIDAGGTTVLGYDAPDEPVYPTLIRLRTEKAYFVDKPIFRIGAKQEYCDLFILDNNCISRSHADIITRGNRHYIVDRNSTNKTFVNGKAIPAEKEIEIFSGTQIRLANEDFVFSIEL